MEKDRSEIRDRGDYFPTITWGMAIFTAIVVIYYIFLGIYLAIKWVVLSVVAVIVAIYDFLTSWPGMLIPIAIGVALLAFVVWFAYLFVEDWRDERFLENQTG